MVMSTVVEAEAPAEATPEVIMQAEGAADSQGPVEAVEASWGGGGGGRGRGWGLSYRKAEVEWLMQISKHLTHCEERLMMGNLMGHEVVRQIGILIEAFSPPPVGIGAGS